MIDSQRPAAASRPMVGRMSSRSAQPTQRCSRFTVSVSMAPLASLTVRFRVTDSMSTWCRTTTARGRSHCSPTVTAAIEAAWTPVTTISGMGAGWVWFGTDASLI